MQYLPWPGAVQIVDLRPDQMPGFLVTPTPMNSRSFLYHASHFTTLGGCGTQPRSRRRRGRVGAVALAVAILSTGTLLQAQTTTTFTGAWEQFHPDVFGPEYYVSGGDYISDNYPHYPNMVFVEFRDDDSEYGYRAIFHNLIAAAFTEQHAGNQWSDANAWSAGTPGEFTHARIIDDRNSNRTILLPNIYESAAVAKSLTISAAEGGGNQLVVLSGGTLNLTPAAAELLKVGMASTNVGETRYAGLTLDGTALTSTGLATIGIGMATGTGGLLKAEMRLENNSYWYHPSGLIEVGGGDGTGILHVGAGSVLAGDFFPGVGQDPRLFINAGSSVQFDSGGTGRLNEISVNSTNGDNQNIPWGLIVDSGSMLETNRLQLGEITKGIAVLWEGSESQLGAVSIAKDSRLSVRGRSQAASVNLDNGSLVVSSTWPGSLLVGDPDAPGSPFTALLQVAAQTGTAASLLVGKFDDSTPGNGGTVTVHGSAILGGYGIARVDINDHGVLDIRGTVILGQKESGPEGVAGSGTVNVVGPGSVLRAQNYEVAYVLSGYALNPTGNINVGDAGRVEVTGSTSEFNYVILGQPVHGVTHRAGTMTIGMGGTLDFLASTGKVTFIDPSNGGTLEGIQELINYGLIKGGDSNALGLEAQIDFGARGGRLTNHGTISPGHSAGGMMINGDLGFGTGGKLVIELGGTNAGVGYDVLHITGNVDFSSGILEVVLLPGFDLQSGATFNFLQVDGGIGGSFSSLIDHTGWGLTLANLLVGEHDMSLATTVAAVPEPASLAAVLGILAGVMPLLPWWRRFRATRATR